MPRVHATSAHSFSGDKLLELMKLSLEDKEEVPPEEVDPNDPCSMCPCCRARRTPVSQRTQRMKDMLMARVINGELAELAQVPACCLKSEEDKLALGAAWFIKAALSEHGFGIDLPMSNMDTLLSSAAEHGADFVQLYHHPDMSIPVAARMVTKPVQLLVSVAIQLMAIDRPGPPNNTEAIRIGLIGIKALELNSELWQDKLARFKLKPQDVELCLRLGLATVYRRNSKISPSSRVRQKYRKLLESQALAVQKMDPLNWPNCLALADLTDDYAAKAAMLGKVLEVADEAQEDRAQSLLRWELCHAILLGGEGPTFWVNRVLHLVKQARVHKAASFGWCSDLMAGDKLRYWRCLGVAGRLSGAVKRDPDFAQKSLLVFASEDDLDQELVHTMCDGCRKLSEKLQKCAGCELATYCSKDCQRQHWRAGHKSGCRSFSKPRLTEQEIMRLLNKEDGSNDNEEEVVEDEEDQDARLLAEAMARLTSGSTSHK